MNVNALVQAAKLARRQGNRAQERREKRKEMLERRKEARGEVSLATNTEDVTSDAQNAATKLPPNRIKMKALSTSDTKQVEDTELAQPTEHAEPAAEPSPTRREIDKAATSISRQERSSILQPRDQAENAASEDARDQGGGLFDMMGGLISAMQAGAEERDKEAEEAAANVEDKPDSDVIVDGRWAMPAPPPQPLPEGMIVLPNYRQMWSDVVFTRAKIATQSTNFDRLAVSRLSWGTLCNDRGGSDPWAVVDGRSLDKQLQWRFREGANPPMGQHQDAGPPEIRAGTVPSTQYQMLSKGIEPPPEFPRMPSEPVKCNYDRWTGDLKISEVKRVNDRLQELKDHRDMLQHSCERWVKQMPQLHDAKPPTPDFVSPFVLPEMYCDKKTGSTKKPKLTTCPTEASKLQRKSVVGQISAVRMKIMVERAQGLPQTGLAGGIHAYVVVLVVDGDPLKSAGEEKEQWKGETEMKESSEPAWSQELVTDEVKVRKKTHLHFIVVDAGIGGAVLAHTLLGQAAIPLSQVLRGGWGDIKPLALAPMIGEDGEPEDKYDLKECRIFVKVGWEAADYKGGAVQLGVGMKFDDVPHPISPRARAAKARRKNRIGESPRKSKRGSLRRASLKEGKRASTADGA